LKSSAIGRHRIPVDVRRNARNGHSILAPAARPVPSIRMARRFEWPGYSIIRCFSGEVKRGGGRAVDLPGIVGFGSRIHSFDMPDEGYRSSVPRHKTRNIEAIVWVRESIGRPSRPRQPQTISVQKSVTSEERRIPSSGRWQLQKSKGVCDILVCGR